MSANEQSLATLDASIIEKALVAGDLSKLTSEQRLSYYNHVCKSLGLNPLTKPFEYIVLNGKMQLYARKDCTDQLRVLKKVSVSKVEHVSQPELGIYVVTAIGKDGEGREDTGTGAVNVQGLKGDALANAIMKAETKAKRRLTLSLCGLGMIDETELETIRGAQPVGVKIVSGTLNEVKPVDGGRSGVKIGDEKLWVTDLAIDSRLAGAEGKEIEVEAIERLGPKGKYWEIVAVKSVGRFDQEHPVLEESQITTRKLESPELYFSK